MTHAPEERVLKNSSILQLDNRKKLLEYRWSVTPKWPELLLKRLEIRIQRADYALEMPFIKITDKNFPDFICGEFDKNLKKKKESTGLLFDL